MDSVSSGVLNAMDSLVKTLGKENKKQLMKFADENPADAGLVVQIFESGAIAKARLGRDDSSFGRGTQYLKVINKELLLQGMCSQVPELYDLAQHLMCTKQKHYALKLFCVGGNVAEDSKMSDNFPRVKAAFWICWKLRYDYFGKRLGPLISYFTSWLSTTPNEEFLMDFNKQPVGVYKGVRRDAPDDFPEEQYTHIAHAGGAEVALSGQVLTSKWELLDNDSEEGPESSTSAQRRC